MLHQQALVVVYMTYFVRQIFLWGCSFPHDSVHFVRQLPFQNPEHPIPSASTQRNIQPKTQGSCQVERLIIDLKRKPWWLLYTYTSGEGRSLVLRTWHCLTTSPQCLTGAGSLDFLHPQQGHWTGYHALWSHTLSPADWEDACLLSLTHCWQVPLTAIWSPGASVMVNKAPITGYTILIPTTHFTPINNTENLLPEEVFIATAATINLNITNKFKRSLIVWPIRKLGLISAVWVILYARPFGWTEKKPWPFALGLVNSYL